ncbi:MAG: FtsW/RodA/SpoVE family cell cycle protein [Candidatus Marinimicrobia bacterium]|nr:FtsW/RodA/SpoVE family cell cycle protein [Candidatus Neomarinimicrobiota bacterium]
MKANKIEYPLSFKVFMITLAVLILGGMLILFSASTRVALNIDGNANSFFESHIKYLVLSILFGFVFYLIDYKILKKFAWLFIIIAFTLMAITLIKKFSTGNSHPVRWLSVGGHNIFQLAEIVKFALIIYISSYIANHKDTLGQFRKGLMPAMIVSLLLIIMVALTPDFSSAFSLYVIVIVSLYIYGVSGIQLGILSSIFLVLSAIYVFISDYRLARILSYFNPDDINNGGYQLHQSMISLSGGGLFGRGFGNSTGKNLFLPEAHTDFIFSIAGEELGFITTSLILIAFVVLFVSMLKLAKQVNDPFGKSIIFATAFSIIIYALANAIVCVGLLPVTGLPMPFISKSGSQLLINLALIGICMNVIKQSQHEAQKKAEFLHEL